MTKRESVITATKAALALIESDEDLDVQGVSVHGATSAVHLKWDDFSAYLRGREVTRTVTAYGVDWVGTIDGVLLKCTVYGKPEVNATSTVTLPLVAA